MIANADRLICQNMNLNKMHDWKRQIQFKAEYFWNSLLKIVTRTELACPSCGCRQSSLVKRKFLVSSLRRCLACMLLFRRPTSSEHESIAFYQQKYQQGFTTNMPASHERQHLKNTLFKGSEKDYSHYIKVLKALELKPGAKLLDYGCSWGYGSWQLQRAGYAVQSYEISRPRCEYARRYMGVAATWDTKELEEHVDIFFSAHVLEHVFTVQDVISLAMKLLKPGGCFIAFTPNGSKTYRKANPWQWQRSWGLVHPNLLDDEYYRLVFNHSPFLIASSPYDYDAINEWMRTEDHKGKQRIMALGGEELLCVAKMANIQPEGPFQLV